MSIHLQQSLSMASLDELSAILQSRMSDLLVMSGSYGWLVRFISWFFITLSISFWAPIVFLILFDFSLWLWRLAFPVTTPRNRRRPESLNPPGPTT